MTKEEKLVKEMKRIDKILTRKNKTDKLTDSEFSQWVLITCLLGIVEEE